MTIENLLIVESPAKAKTINKYLGKTFKVIASFGHVRDLPKKNGSIDIKHQFAPKFQIITKNKKHIDEIIADSKKSNVIYLATDPDREGEAIAWHIAQILQSKKETANKKILRVTFNQITQKSVIDAINNPRELDLHLVDAQLSRLTLDYLIGFNVSPLLWKKIKSGLSAGRVQSPALRLICEREKDIKEFISEDYFSIHLDAKKDNILLDSKLIEYKKEKITIYSLKDEKLVNQICDQLKQFKEATVTDIITKEKKRSALPPFITSSLQIEAYRKLGFNTDKTMKVAQSLYEGIDIGGLITYMRTDSVNISDQAVHEIREFIKSNYSKDYLPNQALSYKNKVKNAQEAHEAIRPTDITKTPSKIKSHLNIDQYKLYELIWQRALASQFANAVLETTSVTLSVDNAYFLITGVVIKFDGFMRVYLEGKEESIKNDSEEDGIINLPALKINEKLPISAIRGVKHKTEPKPRYSEASLVKSLEDLGIGRPSTYASIISTLKKREYVLMEKKRFIPTDVGAVVNQFLTTHLPKYVDYQFTANLEDTLDEISNGTKEKLPVLNDFWVELEKSIQEKQSVARSEVLSEKLDEQCPQCGKQLVARLGKYGKFIACTGYPECKYIAKIKDVVSKESEIKELEVVEDKICPQDGGVLVIRNGRYGKFISCKNYPKCKYIENINNNDNENSLKDQISCPECKTGIIVAKKNRYGNWFYACNNYPTCKTLFNHQVIKEECANCRYSVLMHKVTKRYGEEYICPKCKFKK